MFKPMEASSDKPVNVAIGIIGRDEHLLISQRRAGDRFANLWEFPGGKQQPEESIEQCLHREISEELGIDIAIVRSLPPIKHTYPGLCVRLHPFLCRTTSGKPQARASQQIRWVTLDELSRLTFPSANQPLLETLKSLFESESLSTLLHPDQ